MHLIGPPHKIKEIASLGFHPVKRNNQTHIFTTTDIDIPTEFVKCAGCEFCVKTKQKYALYPPLLLLPTNTEISKNEAIELLKKFPNCTHVAVNNNIQSDHVRRPQIIPILGDFGEFVLTPTKQDLNSAFFATSIQNGIFQTWAPLYTMFSRGNITEKHRVLHDFHKQNAIKNKVVIDLYVGIGYFTFSYAKQQPKRIYAWEINRWSVEGLKRAAKVNKFALKVVEHDEEYIPNLDDFIVVFLEDNQNLLKRLPSLDLKDLTHVNMGLLPTSREAFNLVDKVRKQASPVVHVHENVRIGELESWKEEVEMRFGECLHVEKIKEYSPGVVHVCGDFNTNIPRTK